MSKKIYVAVFVVVMALAVAGSAQAQSSWGVQASRTPNWTALKAVSDVTEMNLAGNEFQVGIVRGRSLSGDWGVAFVRNRLNKDVEINDLTNHCDPSACYPVGTLYQFDNVTTTGLEVHKFLPFVTIKERAQIGLNFAGGVAWFGGTAQKSEYNGDRMNGSYRETHTTVNIAETLKEEIGFSMMPTFKLELVGAAIVTERIKVKVGGGVGFPGYSRFNVGVVYLF